MNPCEQLVAEELKDDLTPAQVKQVFQQLDKNAERIMRAGNVLGYEQAIQQAAREIGDKLKASIAIEKRNAAYNAKVRLEALNQIKTNWTPDKWGEGLLAFMEGTYRDVGAGRLSVAARQDARKHRYAAGFMSDIERTGLLKEFASGAFDDDIARALHMVDDPNAKFDGPKEAMELAKVIRNWQEKARIDANRVGAWIGKEENYIHRQAHDDLKIMAKGEVAWIDNIIDKLDWDKIEAEHIVEDRRTWLRQVYSNLAAGVHLKAGDGAGFSGPGNLAKKISQSRVLHFKDAESFIAYNKEFGFSERMADNVMRMLDHAGRTTELMAALGTNPGAMINDITKRLADGLETASPEARKAFGKYAKKVQNSLSVVDGTIHTIEGGMQNVAKWGYLLRAHASLTKLGGMIMSQLSDLGVMGSAFQYDGGSYLGAIGKSVQGLTEGRSAAEKQRLYAGLGHYADAFNQSLSAFTTGIDTPSGMTGKVMNLFFKLNLSEWWQTGNRNAAFSFYAGMLGDQRGKGFADLLPETQRALRQYGISPEQWEVMRQVADKTEDGRDWITFDALRKVGDDQIDTLIQPRIAEIKQVTADKVAQLEAANQRELGWLESRIEKFAAMREKAQEILRKYAGTRDKSVGKLSDKAEAQIEMLQARLERAEVEADIAAYLRTQTNIDRTRQAMYSVEDGREADNVMRQMGLESQRFSTQRGGIGEALGKRQKAIEQRIKDIEQRMAKAEDSADKEVAKKSVELGKRIATRLEELEAFTTALVERQEKRTEISQAWQDAVGSKIDRARADMRDELETKLSTYYTDRVANAHLLPDAGTMRVMTQGTERGSVAGELLRFIGQFKAFPTAFVRQTIGRELYGRRGLEGKAGMSELAGTAKLIASMTAFGYLSMALKDLAKGRQPRGLQDPGDDSDGVYYADLPYVNEKTLVAALVQGGGMGIYGDFLFGEMKNRNGQGFVSTLAGPVIGNVGSIVDVLGRMKSGEDPRATAAKLALNNVPLVNLFYTKMLLDYYITWNMMEVLNPGSVYRMERRIEKEQNTQFWLPPSSATR